MMFKVGDVIHLDSKKMLDNYNFTQEEFEEDIENKTFIVEEVVGDDITIKEYLIWVSDRVGQLLVDESFCILPPVGNQLKILKLERAEIQKYIVA